MLNKINSYWKNLLFDIVLGLILLGLIIYSVITKFGSFNTPLFVAYCIYYILALHGLLLIALSIKNFIGKEIIKGFAFLFTSIVLYAGLCFTYISFAISLAVLGGLPVDDYEVRNFDNFRKTKRCDTIDSTNLKIRIQNLKTGHYSDSLTKKFIQEIKTNYEEKSEHYEVGGINSFSEFLPDRISKMECGCRRTDSKILVIRIWDAHGRTYLLELKKENRQWVYKDLYPLTFY